MTTCSVLAVLKSGGWCGEVHAERLAEAVRTRSDTHLTVLTDLEPKCHRWPLKYGWPGWWSKLEICRPDIEGDVLYFDLDTMLFGDITPLMVGRDALLGDFYRKRLESGVMYLTAESRARIWRAFTKNPEGVMTRWRMDGRFFAHCLPHAKDLRQLVDGVHSYKVHGLRDDTRVLCFHGRPRPHETPLWT